MGSPMLAHKPTTLADLLFLRAEATPDLGLFTFLPDAPDAPPIHKTVRDLAEDVRALAQAAGRRGAMIFIDEIYLDSLDAARGRTAFGAADNIFTASSLTKVYGLSGLRCGWIVAPAPLARTLRRVVDHLSVLHVFIAEQIAARLFPHLEAIKETNRALHESNRKMVAEFIAAEPRLSWIEPPAGILGFPRVEGPAGGDALAEILKTRYGTSVVPGGFFEDPRHFRIGWGVAADVLAKGLENIRSALRD